MNSPLSYCRTSLEDFVQANGLVNSATVLDVSSGGEDVRPKSLSALASTAGSGEALSFISASSEAHLTQQPGSPSIYMVDHIMDRYFIHYPALDRSSSPFNQIATQFPHPAQSESPNMEVEIAIDGSEDAHIVTLPDSTSRENFQDFVTDFRERRLTAPPTASPLSARISLADVLSDPNYPCAMAVQRADLRSDEDSSVGSSREPERYQNESPTEVADFHARFNFEHLHVEFNPVS